MKKTLLLIPAILIFQILRGQEKVSPYELGSTLLSVNSENLSNYLYGYEPQFRFLPGLFFRYKINRFSVRSQLAYGEYGAIQNFGKSIVDGYAVSSSTKDLSLGVGGQFLILKNKEWVYSFADFSYRNIFTKGQVYGGWSGNSNFSKSVNGFECTFGLGSKIRLVKNVYLSPELGYYLSGRNVVNARNPLDFGQASTIKYSENFFSAKLKMHLTVQF